MVTWKRDNEPDWEIFQPVTEPKREPPTGLRAVLEALRLNVFFVLLALVISGAVGAFGGYLGMHMVAQSRHPEGSRRSAMAYVTMSEVKEDPAYRRAFWTGTASVGGVVFVSLLGLWSRASKGPTLRS